MSSQDASQRQAKGGEPDSPNERLTASPLPEDVTVATDTWRTIKRVLPRDIYELIKSIESDIADAAGVGHMALGASVTVWTVISRYLDEHRAELKMWAEDWKDDNPK